MFETAIVGEVTWTQVGGLVLGITTILFGLFGAMGGLISRMLFAKIDSIRDTQVSMSLKTDRINDYVVRHDTKIKGLSATTHDLQDDIKDLHARITEVQGGK